jgi:hypothetical protein
MDRKTELELKRQKLAELRKAREERKAAPAPSSTPQASAPVKVNLNATPATEFSRAQYPYKKWMIWLLQ